MSDPFHLRNQKSIYPFCLSFGLLLCSCNWIFVVIVFDFCFYRSLSSFVRLIFWFSFMFSLILFVKNVLLEYISFNNPKNGFVFNFNLGLSFHFILFIIFVHIWPLWIFEYENNFRVEFTDNNKNWIDFTVNVFLHFPIYFCVCCCCFCKNFLFVDSFLKWNLSFGFALNLLKSTELSENKKKNVETQLKR